MKQQKSSGGRKVLVVLIGLVSITVLVVGVLWSTRIIKTGAPVARVPAAKRMKVPPMSEPQRMKVPPALPQLEKPQLSEPAQARATVNPVVSTVMSVPLPLQEVIEPAAIPAPQIEEETRDAVALDEASESGTTAEDTPAPEENEVEQSAREISQATPTVAASQKTPMPAAAKITERYNLQVGAYRVEANAREAVAKLSKKGYAPFILEITDTHMRTWYTVRIGRFETRKNAAASLDKFKRNENISAVIAKAGKL